ncbi:MAG: D-2-hydroxyacid dehydrogenase [Planctomycetales bacterium]|nr:D-2-hydroxyacid dehydrogenase [Planctomycetales bacterium]
MKLVIHPAVEESRLSRIREVAGSMQVINAADPSTALREIADADAFFGKLTPELLSHANQLRWVQAATASLEHYLFPALVDHPCWLSNMRGLFSDVIADHVLGFVLCFARNFPRYIRQQQHGIWEPVGGEAARTDFVSGPGVINAIDQAHRHLADCTLGVVGVGQIGAEVLRRARAFGMRVIGVDPIASAVPGLDCEVWKLDQLPVLLKQSDFVVIAAPHTPETFKLFRLAQFEHMKRSAYLINIGRGVIVDLADLTAALQRGLIAGAGLDVCETEPLPSDHPLWRMENVIITPHVAGASPRISERHLETLLENIRRFVVGDPPTTLVDKRRWF